jgi:hypothetical protein
VPARAATRNPNLTARAHRRFSVRLPLILAPPRPGVIPPWTSPLDPPLRATLHHPSTRARETLAVGLGLATPILLLSRRWRLPPVDVAPRCSRSPCSLCDTQLPTGSSSSTLSPQRLWFDLSSQVRKLGYPNTLSYGFTQNHVTGASKACHGRLNTHYIFFVR